LEGGRERKRGAAAGVGARLAAVGLEGGVGSREGGRGTSTVADGPGESGPAGATVANEDAAS